MPLIEDAQRIYDEFKAANPLFPHRWCRLAVIAMYKIGYGIIQGEVYLDNYCNLGLDQIITHYWNYDPLTGQEGDLTSDQFNIHISGLTLPKIAVWKRGSRPRFYREFRRDLQPHEVI